MKINCAYDDLVPISKVKPHPKNPNKHSEAQLERLAQIIEYQGWRCPIKVSNLSGFVVAGHGRLLAAKKNGYTQVPIDYQDFDSEGAHRLPKKCFFYLRQVFPFSKILECRFCRFILPPPF